MVKIFIIGNIGSGKSLFSEKLNFALNRGLDKSIYINLDDIGHEVYESAEIQKDLHNAFGDFSSRAELAKIAFLNNDNKSRLEKIMHSSILDCLDEMLADADNQSYGYAVVEQTAFSGDFDKCICRADKIICVVANDDIRLERCLMRGMSEEDFQRRNAQQMAQNEISAFADFVIDNNGNEAELLEKIDKLLGELG